MRFFTFCLFLFSTFYFPLRAQQTGIKGRVSGENKEPLGFATVFIRNLNTGTTTNAEGFYEFKLPPGKYDVVFQYIGYESEVHFFEITDGYVSYNPNLKPRVLLLKEIEIRAGKEDPAYTIMRKAIGKASFHANQLDEYSAKVYIKGSGRLLDAPFFLEAKIAEEGIDSTMAFTSESVSELHYKRPDTWSQKVIAVFSQGDDNGTGPGQFITSSFYEPKVVDAISPLSPKAFAYYRFQYEGYFMDGKHLINKIAVIPRSAGDDVFEGSIFIVNDEWSIHSLDLKMYKLGIEFKLKQLYNPIEDKAWLPVSYHFDVNGTFFGFEFEYKYLATISDYVIQLNPDLDIPITVIDEKVEREKASEIKQKTRGEETLEKLARDEVVTRKDLRKLMKEYEKEEMEEMDFPDVTSNISFNVDSTTSYNNDSAFWSNVRPVPLTEYELRGYAKDTADADVSIRFGNDDKKKTARDTSRVKKQRKFKLTHLVAGHSWKTGERSSFNIRAPIELAGFNTVEGFNFSYEFYLRKSFENGNRLDVGPVARYAIAREKLIGQLYADLRHSKGDGNTRIEGGRFVEQLNAEGPIHPHLNTAYSLLLKENYLKLYEKDYLKLSHQKKYSEAITLKASAEIAERRMLNNNTTYSLFRYPDKQYTSNQPANAELGATDFEEHRAAILELSTDYKPFLKYEIRNGSGNVLRNSSPVFSLSYRKGVAGVFSSDTDYDLLEAGVSYSFDWEIRGKADLKVSAGKFLNTNKLYFIDFKHFPGNQTIFSPMDPTRTYRLLDYYYYSTGREYLSAFGHYQFRKLALTQLRFFRMKGVKENLFINYLGTPDSDNYAELGYGIDYLFRVLKLEAVAAFEGGKYAMWGIRLGIATDLEDIFDFD